MPVAPPPPPPPLSARAHRPRSAGWKAVGKGTVRTIFEQDGKAEVVFERKLTDSSSVVVTYDNPLVRARARAAHGLPTRPAPPCRTT